MPHRPLFIFIFLNFICFQTNSVELQRYDAEIDPFNPNYLLLNEGLFRAANEIREQNNLPLFLKNSQLQKAAELHAYLMITQNFYSHKNPNDSKLRNLVDRIKYIGNGKMDFNSLAENIAHYDLLATESMFCLKKRANGLYNYYDCKTKKSIPIYTYKDLARTVVQGWMKSPSHRESLLDINYKYLGTAARLSQNPFSTQNPPFARIVQNFGSLK